MSDTIKTENEVLDRSRTITAGARVRHRSVPNMTGTVLRRFRGKYGDWLVWWDGHQSPIGTFEENMEAL